MFLTVIVYTVIALLLWTIYVNKRPKGYPKGNTQGRNN